MEALVEETHSTAANGTAPTTTTTASARSGKRKGKRKNKSKNTNSSGTSQDDQQEEQHKLSANGVNSEIGKANGVIEDVEDECDEATGSVETVVEKLKHSLTLGCNKNGLTNGIDCASGEEQHSQQQNTAEASANTTAAVVGKKRSRAKQKSKSQTEKQEKVETAHVDSNEAQTSKDTACSAGCKTKPTPVGTVWTAPLVKSPDPTPPPPEPPKPQITYQVYDSELQMPSIMSLIQKDLSEPYSIYTYRYFIHNWPKLCFLARHEDRCVGAIVCKLDIHGQNIRRGYIAMLAVDKDYRKLKIGTTLVQKAIQAMVLDNADEVVLETEITNRPALRLYENLGFVRDKRLFHYYLNGVDALRLKLWFR